MHSTKNWIRLFTDCISDLTDNKVTVYLPPTKTVYVANEDIHCGGFWSDGDEENLFLACAAGGDIGHWGPIFAHEYCHYLQWKDKCKEWKKSNKLDIKVADIIFSNKPIEKKELDRYLKTLRDLELDCEKRTVELLTKYKVGINIKAYIKASNAYIYFYTHIKEYRKWYPKDDSPYRNEKLIKAAPDTLDNDYNVIPEKMKKIFDEIYPIKKESNVV